MAPPADLREWIALLEREGELVRVGAEVDPDLEITEIVDRTVKAGGPALLFERPKGSTHPLLINQFGTERRMCLAFGAPNLDAVGARVADVLEMQPPQGLAEKVRGLKKLKSIADSQPKRLRAAAEARRRAHARGLPARRARRARPRHDRRPRGAGERGDRPRGLRAEGRPRRRGAVRRPHRLLHGGRAVPGLPRHGGDDAA